LGQTLHGSALCGDEPPGRSAVDGMKALRLRARRGYRVLWRHFGGASRERRRSKWTQIYDREIERVLSLNPQRCPEPMSHAMKHRPQPPLRQRIAGGVRLYDGGDRPRRWV